MRAEKWYGGVAMKLRSALPMVLGAALLVGGAAYAKKPTDFQAPQQMTEEELAAAKERSKNKLNGFDEKMEEKPKPFPWMAVGLAAIAFLVAAPFGLRAFKQTSKEITGAESSLGPNSPAE
jgi:hypothetical protein